MLDFLTGIIDWINGGIGYYAVSLIIFTLMIRVLVLPLDVTSRKGMRKMAKIQPLLNEIQTKYKNDQAKLQRKQQELMQREHYNPLSGCLPMLLQYPILIIMFYSMRYVANREMARQVLQAIAGNGYPVMNSETFIWVKNIWAPDSFLASVAPTTQQLAQLDANTWVKAFSELTADPARYGMTLEQCAQLLQTIVEVNPGNMTGLSAVTEEWFNALEGTQLEQVLTALNATVLPSFGELTMDQTTAILNAMNSNFMVPLTADAATLNSLFRTFAETEIVAKGGALAADTCLCSCSVKMTTSTTAFQTLYSQSAFYLNQMKIAANASFLGNVFANPNGFMILALLSLGSQLLMTKINPTTPQEQQAANSKDQNQQGQGMNKFMKYFFPAFSFYCCVSSYAAFALYWVASNLIMIGLTVGINKYLDSQEAKKAAGGKDNSKNSANGEGKIR